MSTFLKHRWGRVDGRKNRISLGPKYGGGGHGVQDETARDTDDGEGTNRRETLKQECQLLSLLQPLPPANPATGIPGFTSRLNTDRRMDEDREIGKAAGRQMLLDG